MCSIRRRNIWIRTVNVFKGVLDNWIFCVILVGTSILQVLIVQFGGFVMHCVAGGLDAKYWGISLGFGLGSFPVQQLINVLYRLGLDSTKKWRTNRRRRRAKNMTADLQNTNGTGHAHKE